MAFTSALVNGKPAKMLAGNVFETTLDMASGSNTVTVQATDVSGNVTTQNYQVNVTGSGATYTYDPNGNLTSKTEGTDNWTYSWNAENQLTKVEKNGVELARFAYDPLGRRVEKIAGGVTTGYTYDGVDILRETRESITLKYVHGPEVDEPLAVDDGAALSYLHADGLGSIVKTTNATGAVTLTRQYDAWGHLQIGGDQAWLRIHWPRVGSRGRALPLQDPLLRAEVRTLHLGRPDRLRRRGELLRLRHQRTGELGRSIRLLRPRRLRDQDESWAPRSDTAARTHLYRAQ